MDCLRPYQLEAHESAWQRLIQPAGRTMIVSATGCHASGQGILMHDGRIKRVENVEVGDKVMGMDSSPRTVQYLCRGRGHMVRIVPKRGRPWVVNDDHVLTLVRTRTKKGVLDPLADSIVDVSVKEWMCWDKNKKHLYKLFKVPVAFASEGRHNVYPIHPHFLGLLLGDGSFTHHVTFTTADSELAKHAECYARNYSLRASWCDSNGTRTPACRFKIHNRAFVTRSKLRPALKELGLLGMDSSGKFIPRMYKVASREDRLALLAGIIDTDGHKSRSGYDFVTKSHRLFCDVRFVARSLGFAAQGGACRKVCCNNGVAGVYWRLHIGGQNISQLPCALERKRFAEWSSRINSLRTGFCVEDVGEGDYFGFNVDGDGRYLLDDFTVTHNSGKTTIFGATARRWLDDGRGGVLVIAHRDELIEQSVRQMRRWTMREPQVEKAGQRANRNDLFGGNSLVIASIQSLYKDRLREFDRKAFTLIILDECHRATATGFMNVLRHFSAASALLVTATPDRTDKVRIIGGDPSKFPAQDCCYDKMTTLECIREGWLKRPRQAFVHVNSLDLRPIKANGGDFTEKDLEPIINTDQCVAGMVNDEVLGMLGTRPTLWFANSVQHAKHITDMLNDKHCQGKAAYIASYQMDENGNKAEFPIGLRRELIRKFKANEIQHLASYGTLYEGFDALNVEGICWCRPTKSRLIFAQGIGRGLRIPDNVIEAYGDDGKLAWRLATAEERLAAIGDRHCLFIDFVGVVGKHKLAHAADVLLPADLDQEVQEKLQFRLKLKDEKGEASDIVKELEAAEADVRRDREWKRLARQNYEVHAQLAMQWVELDLPTQVPEVRLDGTKAKASADQISYVRRLCGGKYGAINEIFAKDGIDAMARVPWDEKNVENLTAKQAGRVIHVLKTRQSNGPPAPWQAMKLRRAGLVVPRTYEEAKRIMERQGVR